MSASAGPLLNGMLPAAAAPYNEALEYEKILKIRDEVFAGSHPRLTVPAHALRAASSQLAPSESTVSSSLNVPPFSAVASPNHLAATPARRSDETFVQVHSQLDGNAASILPPTSVSEFNPILLTKSDDLVRAETQLKRSRLHQALRDQFEQKRLDARRKPAPAEAKPDFDLAAILTRAVALNKSESPKEDASVSESLDENSFYSSRAPDSTPEQRPASVSTGEDADEIDVDESAAAAPRVSAVMGAPLHPEGEDGEATHYSPRPPQPAFPPMPMDHAPPAAMDMDDEEEEGEYSPPEAMEHFSEPVPHDPQVMQEIPDPRSRPLRRYSELDDSARHPGSPSQSHLRIVRNHITSPLAPQPSRVSPLAVAKDAPLLQNSRRGRPQRAAHPGSPPSPEGPQGGFPPRKKRKTDKNGKKGGRRNGMSPDGLIKEENVSPPPFHDVQPLGAGRLRPAGSDRPIIIDDDPGQEGPYMPGPERYVDSPSRPIHRQVEQLMPLSEPRVNSRASIRPVMRDDQDLRRVASMHNMRVEAPRDYEDPYYESPTRARPAAYGRISSPALVESRDLRELPTEYDRANQEVRVVRTPGPVYREVYDEPDPELRYAPQAMPPPPPIERIVVDRYGRRFREILQPEQLPVVTRAMSVRHNDVEPNYNAYRQSRAGSVYADAAPERSYPQDMPPPPPVSYRRLAETPRTSAIPGSATREYLEPALLPRSASVQQVVDRPSRQPVYADEQQPDYHDRVRMASVRPPPSRYDDMQPVEMISRGQSVRPVAREGSVYLEDRAPVRRQYAPIEQPRYRVVEHQKRYVDAQGREIVPMDDGMDPVMDGRQRMMERY